MIFSDLPSPAEASSHNDDRCQGFAQAGNRPPLFGIMLWLFPAANLAASCPANFAGHFVCAPGMGIDLEVKVLS